MFMPRTSREFTPAEAGAVSGLGRKAIDNAIDKELGRPERHGPGGRGGLRWQRRISEADLVWVYLNKKSGVTIPGERKRALYQRFLEQADAKELRVSHLAYLDVAAARAEIEARAQALDDAKANVVSDPEVLGGEPVFKGTRVPVYDIAASANSGVSRERILAAYSVLHEDAVDQALLYAAAFPPRGRPRYAPRTPPGLQLLEEKVVHRKRSP
jgi:uncharacterized protein (DUF433 family)